MSGLSELLRRGATEEEEEKEEPGVSEEKQKPHTEMWGKKLDI